MTRTTTMFLLGAPRVEAGGAPVEVDTRKATALLAYLAVTGRRHTRDALAGLLWPEYSQSRARAALRRTLSSLSGARQGGWLEVDRESIGLDREMTWVDVDRFRELLAECRTHGHAEGEICAGCLDPWPRPWGSTGTIFSRGSGCATAPPSTTGSSSRPGRSRGSRAVWRRAGSGRRRSPTPGAGWRSTLCTSRRTAG